MKVLQFNHLFDYKMQHIIHIISFHRIVKHVQNFSFTPPFYPLPSKKDNLYKTVKGSGQDVNKIVLVYIFKKR
jgi:hypothetical protein